MSALILHDPQGNARIAVEQMEARLMGRCSVCGAPASPDELDSSARCDACQP